MKWIRIFHELNIAHQTIPIGTSKLVIIGEHRICLSNFNNDFFAVQDRCPHSGASLSKGNVNYLGEVVCPLHGYRFHLKGGQEAENKCQEVEVYRIKTDKEGLYIFI